eukprot:scaffold484025_cov32-Prasinocladus_malaysianus.AAC.1
MRAAVIDMEHYFLLLFLASLQCPGGVIIAQNKTPCAVVLSEQSEFYWPSSIATTSLLNEPGFRASGN